MAGGEHRGLAMRGSAEDGRETPPIRVVADWEVVLVNGGLRAAEKARQMVWGLGPAGGVEFRSVDEHEPDSDAPFDVERVAINDPRDVALDAQADGTRTRRRLWIRRRGRRIVADGCGRNWRTARQEDGGDHRNGDHNRDESCGSAGNHPTRHGRRVSSTSRTQD